MSLLSEEPECCYRMALCCRSGPTGARQLAPQVARHLVINRGLTTNIGRSALGGLEDDRAHGRPAGRHAIRPFTGSRQEGKDTWRVKRVPTLWNV